MKKRTTTKGSGGCQSSVEQISTASLIPYARNARTHSEQQISQIAGSIQEFGFCNPVLIDADNGIVAGHGRVLAAQKLKLYTVPCVRLSHLTDAQKRAYVIADNRIALSSGWDAEMLANELSDLHADEFNMALLGFEADELAGLMNLEPAAAETQVDAEARLDEAEELQALWETRLGQVWQCGIHRLMCGSSTEAADVGRLLNGASPQIMVTDPPYGVKYDPSWRKDAGVSDSNRMGKVLNDDIADWTPAWRLFGGGRRICVAWWIALWRGAEISDRRRIRDAGSGSLGKTKTGAVTRSLSLATRAMLGSGQARANGRKGVRRGMVCRAKKQHCWMGGRQKADNSVGDRFQG